MTAPTQKVDISSASYLKFFGVLIGLWLIWYLRGILGMIFAVLIIVAALSPAAKAIEEYGLPRALGLTIIYLAAFLVFAGVISLIVPPLVSQLRTLAQNTPVFISHASPFYQLFVESNVPQALNNLSSQLGAFTGSIYTATTSIFGGALAAVTVIVLSFYALVDAKKTRDSLVILVPAHYLKRVTDITTRSGEKLGAWLRGQLLLSFIVACITFVGLLILGIPYALTLAVLAGFLEIIPLVGPIIAGLTAMVVAYVATGSWQLVLGVFVFYVIVQQTESHFLVPKVMSNAVGLSPIIVIIALAIGAELAGIAGAILAVPIAATLSVILPELPQFRRRTA